MGKPLVSIIILNWNGLKDTIECLESIKKIDYPNYEVIVVDNGSTDGSPEKIKRLFPEVILIKNKENRGFAGGNNVGIKHAVKNGAVYLWLLNNDAVIEPSALTKLVKSGEESPKIGILTPIIYYHAAPLRAQFYGSFFDNKNFSLIDPQDLTRVRKLKEKKLSIWGTAMLIKRKVIDSVGYLDEKYFAYWEDTEYSHRALNAGFENKVEPSAKVFHKSHIEDGREKFPPHYYYYMVRNKYFFWNGNTRGLRKVVFLRKYLATMAWFIGYFRDKGKVEAVSAMLDGLYCALRDKGGKWDKGLKMPIIARKLFLTHPYLLAYLLNWDFKEITAKIFQQRAVPINSNRYYTDFSRINT
jgi:GT2 family glycosyltransferase